MFLRLGGEVPIDRRLKELRESGRDVNLTPPVRRPGLNEQDADMRTLCETRGQSAARASRSDHDVIVHVGVSVRPTKHYGTNGRSVLEVIMIVWVRATPARPVRGLFSYWST